MLHLQDAGVKYRAVPGSLRVQRTRDAHSGK